MATATELTAGTEVRVTEGAHKGLHGTIKTGFVVPDEGGIDPVTEQFIDPEHRRKMLVELKDGSGLTYILPRQLMTISNVIGVPQGITDPMDPSLDRFRPDPSIVEKYKSRIVPGGFTDTEFLLHLRSQRDNRGFSPNVALVGDTQSGKTMLVEVLAVLAAREDGMPKPYPVFTLSGSSSVTSYDLFGMTTAVIIDGVETLVWMEGIVPIAARCGGFLYFDEWNAVPPAQATALHPLMDDRRMFVNTQKPVEDGHGGYMPERVDANPNLWILVTINPGYKGTQTMAEATSNRFRWLPWGYDEEVEAQLIPSPCIRTIGESLRSARDQNILTMPIGTSALQRFNYDVVEYGVDAALWAFLGVFSPQERLRVQTIIEDDGHLDVLRREYPVQEKIAVGAAS